MGKVLMPRSITLVGEADRKMLKAAIKQSEADQIRHRIIPAEAISAMGDTLAGMTDEIQEILKEEKEEKLVSCCTFGINVCQSLTGRCAKQIWS
jgi:hypothetical protein